MKKGERCPTEDFWAVTMATTQSRKVGKQLETKPRATKGKVKELAQSKLLNVIWSNAECLGMAGVVLC